MKRKVEYEITRCWSCCAHYKSRGKADKVIHFCVHPKNGTQSICGFHKERIITKTDYSHGMAMFPDWCPLEVIDEKG